MYQKVLIIKSQASDELEIAKISQYIEKTHDASVHSVVLETFLELDEFDEESLFLTYLNDENLKLFLSKVINQSIDVLIIANKECTKAIKSYNLINDFKESIDNAFTKENLSTIDILTANDRVVYSSVIFGDVYGMNKEVLPNDSIFKRVRRFFFNLKKLQFHPYKLQTKNENIIDTVATGILIYEHNLKHSNSEFINEDISLHDGQLNALILAPKSIFSLIYLLFVLFVYQRFSLAKLPKSIGLIKSETLKVTSNQQGFDFLIDGVGVSAKEVQLKVNKDALALHLGKRVDEEVEKSLIKDETMQIHDLPKGEYKKLLLKNVLPLFKKAEADDFKELFKLMRSASTLGSIYIVLMICSTLLATVGLFLDSGPVIIGAMILAPLMAPIVSLSMGVVRNDARLIQNSTKTIGFGVLLALLSAAIFTLIMPIELHTSQIAARLQPNILDLFVAIFSGIAAAYAYSKEEVAKSLAGVAIAVALVPPLAVTGIGIGWMNFDVILGSFLLFITNLVGITIAASITFIILGFAPLVRAKKGILYTVITLVIVSIPLAMAFSEVMWQNIAQSKVANQTSLQLSTHTIEYKVLGIEKTNNATVKIELEVISKEILAKEDLKEIKNLLQEKFDEEIELQVRTKIII